MTKADLIERLCNRTKLTKKECEDVIRVFLNTIIGALGRGDKVELRGFGSFRIKQYGPRNGRNPKTGESVSVPAKKRPFFRCGKELKDMINS